jgi:hypothetical protein
MRNRYLAAAVFVVFCSGAALAGEKTYVGAQACRECHAGQYENYTKFSKKASSFESVRIMESKLTREEVRTCYECHSTGYGKPGGFVSEKETPGLKNAGCESCHGPGSVHAASGDPADIRADLSLEDCTGCHNSDRVEAFDFKPLLFGGAH